MKVRRKENPNTRNNAVNHSHAPSSARPERGSGRSASTIARKGEGLGSGYSLLPSPAQETPRKSSSSTKTRMCGSNCSMRAMRARTPLSLRQRSRQPHQRMLGIPERRHQSRRRSVERGRRLGVDVNHTHEKRAAIAPPFNNLKRDRAFRSRWRSRSSHFGRSLVACRLHHSLCVLQSECARRRRLNNQRRTLWRLSGGASFPLRPKCFCLAGLFGSVEIAAVQFLAYRAFHALQQSLLGRTRKTLGSCLRRLYGA